MKGRTFLAVMAVAMIVLTAVPVAHGLGVSTSVESRGNGINLIAVPIESIIDANDGSSEISGTTGGPYYLVEDEDDGGVYVQKDSSSTSHSISGKFDVTVKMPSDVGFYIKVNCSITLLSSFNITLTVDGKTYTKSISGETYLYLEEDSSGNMTLKSGTESEAKNGCTGGSEVGIEFSGRAYLATITAKIYLAE